MATILETLSWIFVIFSIAGAFETASDEPDLLKCNILFFINNAFSVAYFSITMQPAYILLYLIFSFLSIKGIYVNEQKRN